MKENILKSVKRLSDKDLEVVVTPKSDTVIEVKAFTKYNRLFETVVFCLNPYKQKYECIRVDY